MYMTSKTRAAIDFLLRHNVPEDIYVTIDDSSDPEVSSSIGAQCANQDAVRRFRQAFGGGMVWKKEWSANCKWWSYTATVDGMNLYIYACREAPPTCKAIVEKVMVEEKVPVVFETRIVERERMRWDCSGEGSAE